MLLVCHRVPDRVHAVIAESQLRTHGSDHACATHVAIYAGNGLVHDATPAHGVATRPLAGLVADGWLRARRLAQAQPADQQAVEAEARVIVGSGAGYSRLKAFLHGLLTHTPVLPANWHQVMHDLMHATGGRAESVFYCSSFVQRAHMNAVGLGASYQLAPMPADFSVDPNWAEVAIRW